MVGERNTPRTVVSVKMDVELLRRIDDVARKRNVPRSRLIEEALRRYLEEVEELE